MKLNKYWLCILMVMLVIAVASACGGGNKATQPPAGNTTQPPAGSDTTPTTAGDPDKGLAVFKNNCLACHGAGGTGGHNGPDLRPISSDPDAAIAVIKGGRGIMPAFEGVLTEEQINDVAAYINQVIGGKQ